MENNFFVLESNQNQRMQIIAKYFHFFLKIELYLVGNSKGGFDSYIFQT